MFEKRGIGVLFWYASTKTFSSVHTDNGCGQCHCERVVCVVCLCLSVLEAPSVSLRHVRNAAGEVGDERKERVRKGQEDGILRTRHFKGHMAVFVSVFITFCPSKQRRSPPGFALVKGETALLLFLSPSLSLGSGL